MKATVVIISFILSSLLFGQPMKKTLLLQSKKASVYLLEKDTLSTGENKLLLESHDGQNYLLAVRGGTIFKSSGFWVFRPSRSVESIGMRIYQGNWENPRCETRGELKVKLSPQEQRRKELGL